MCNHFYNQEKWPSEIICSLCVSLTGAGLNPGKQTENTDMEMSTNYKLTHGDSRWLGSRWMEVT